MSNWSPSTDKWWNLTQHIYSSTALNCNSGLLLLALVFPCSTTLCFNFATFHFFVPLHFDSDIIKIAECWIISQANNRLTKSSIIYFTFLILSIFIARLGGWVNTLISLFLSIKPPKKHNMSLVFFLKKLWFPQQDVSCVCGRPVLNVGGYERGGLHKI